MASTTWYTVCAAGYFLALFIYIANLVAKRVVLRKAATITVALSFLAQTAGLVFRWMEAGEVEVRAVEIAQDVQLEGLAYLVVYTQHPPWSNLYEIMVFMAWGVVLVFIVSEVKWRIRVAGIFALLMALIALGLASLTGDATIKPLVPALQSWWIMIHVISSAVGYAAITIGATMGLLFLVKAKERVTMTAVGAGTMLLSTTILLILGRGKELFTSMAYKVKLMGVHEGVMEPIGLMKNGAFRIWFEPSPAVGPLLIAAVVVSFIAALWMGLGWRFGELLKKVGPLAAVGGAIQGVFKSPTEQSDSDGSAIGAAKLLYFVGFGITTATVGLILINALAGANIQPPELVEQLGPAIKKGMPIASMETWRLSITSNQWDLALFVIVWGSQFFVALAMLKPNVLRDLLPEAPRLDRASYYTLLIAFALVAVVLVTGALWAHYAWGRYWGWDPKETGALVIWITLAIYLHARVTYGWVGVPSAVIGILAFFVMLAGFLGVNLGWFADGLHSYGSA